MPQANVTLPAGACVPKQSYLVDYFGANTPAGRDTGDYGVLQALKSAMNMAGVQDLSDTMVGLNKKRQTVRLLYKKATCYTVCQKDFVCGATPVALKPLLGAQDYTIDNRYTLCNGGGDEIEVTFDAIEYEQYCQIDNGKYIQELIADADAGFFKRLNDIFAALINTYVPVSQATEIKLTLFNATSNSTLLNPNLKNHIEQLLRDAGVGGLPYMILGGSKIKHIESITGIQAQSLEGFDLSKQGSLGAMYYSKSFDAIDADAIYIIPAGLFQMITWCEYKGALKAVTELLIDNTKMFPIGNGLSIEFDYRSKYDPSCKVRTYQPSLYAELLVTIPGGCGVTDATKLPIWKLTDCTPMPDMTCA